MSGDNMSMREASRVLGVSQIRVRELVRKGTLRAEKIVEDGTERWAIFADAIQDFIARRSAAHNGSGDGAAGVRKSKSPSIPAGAAGEVATIVEALQLQLDRVRQLTEELGKTTAYVAQLKAAQQGLEKELAASGTGAAKPASAPKGPGQQKTQKKPPRNQSQAKPKATAAAGSKAAQNDGPVPTQAAKQEPAIGKVTDQAQPEAKEQPTQQEKPAAQETPVEQSEAAAPEGAKAQARAASQQDPSGKSRPAAVSKPAKSGPGKSGGGTGANTALGAALRDAGVTSAAPSRPAKKPDKASD